MNKKEAISAPQDFTGIKEQDSVFDNIQPRSYLATFGIHYLIATVLISLVMAWQESSSAGISMSVALGEVFPKSMGFASLASLISAFFERGVILKLKVADVNQFISWINAIMIQLNFRNDSATNNLYTFKAPLDLGLGLTTVSVILQGNNVTIIGPFKTIRVLKKKISKALSNFIIIED